MGKDIKNKNVRSVEMNADNAGHISSERALIQQLSNRIRRAKPLYVFSAAMLCTLGLSVVAIAIIGLMRPLWLASLMSFAGSLSTMLGLYLWYELLRNKHRIDTFVKEAIQRAMNSRN